MRRVLVPLLALVGLVLVLLGPVPAASAHEERESQFPAGDGEVPKKRSLKQAADVLVSARTTAASASGGSRTGSCAPST